MILSLRWLRELCPLEESPSRVAAALTSRGLTVDSLQAKGDDSVLEIDVPANRPDCLGHLGVARELSAAFGVPLLRRPDPEPSGTQEIHDLVRIDIAEPDLCPRYTASVVRGVRVGPSPDRVVRRLDSCGLRSINNVVDASNLVLLELGHPIHFFDLERVAVPAGAARRTIVVRRAAEGETLKTLDGVERKLTQDALVIADERSPLALAGIIGGADSEIGAGTRDVLVEAAYFAPSSIRATGKRLGLRTEASYRFARGADVEAVVAAQSLAVHLLEQLAGGARVPGIADAYPRPHRASELTLRASELGRLLGYDPPRPAVERALAALGLAPRATGGGCDFRVTVPSWRVDLEREADLVEEVARHLGYDEIPGTASEAWVPSAAPVGTEEERLELGERAADLLAHRGFHEAVGYAMIGPGEDDRFVAEDAPAALRLANPIAEPLGWLRRSVLPGLLRAADFNLRRGHRDVRLFEIGRVFEARAGGGFPNEPLHLGLVFSGAGAPRHFSAPARPVDLHDAAGIVDLVLDALAPGLGVERQRPNLRAFHPGWSVEWRVESQVVAWCGRLHPDLQGAFEQEVFVAEVVLDRLVLEAGLLPLHRELARVPAVTRDLSLLLSGDVTYAQVLATLAAVPAPAPAAFDVLDRYEGAPLAAGQISLTVRVTLQPVERTLTEGQIETYRQELIAALERQLATRIRS